MIPPATWPAAPRESMAIPSAEVGVARERIRQIESRTMSKLRYPSHMELLRHYLD
jgi:DNA-directed RNA polymerase sigma subunit (sigma70/sigma32)